MRVSSKRVKPYHCIQPMHAFQLHNAMQCPDPPSPEPLRQRQAVKEGCIKSRIPSLTVGALHFSFMSVCSVCSVVQFICL
jgi:hypothetical protein